MARLSFLLNWSGAISSVPCPPQVKGWDKGDAPPCFTLDGVNYMFIRKNSLLLAVTTRFNMSPSMGIELLNRTAKVGC